MIILRNPRKIEHFLQSIVTNILKTEKLLKGYAKRHIMNGQVKTTFYLVIDHRTRDHIINCTEDEAFRVLGNKRELDATELDAFVALLHARCAYQAKNLDVWYLWNKM